VIHTSSSELKYALGKKDKKVNQHEKTTSLKYAGLGGGGVVIGFILYVIKNIEQDV
jgi:hypothetical protein